MIPETIDVQLQIIEQGTAIWQEYAYLIIAYCYAEDYFISKTSFSLLVKIFNLCYTVRHPILTIVDIFLSKLLPSDKTIAYDSD